MLWVWIKCNNKCIIYVFSFKIIDDDVACSSLLPDTLGNRLEDDINVAEDQPVVAGFVDERPEEVQERERFSTKSQWKKLQGIVYYDKNYNVMKKNVILLKY